MKPKPETAGDIPAEVAAVPAETPVMVVCTVIKHAAIIGDAHHKLGKQMKLPKPQAEEAERQGLVKIDGVA